MLDRFTNEPILLAISSAHAKNLLVDILRAHGFVNTAWARSKPEVLQFLLDYRPKIVMIVAEYPDISAVQFARLIRGGYGGLNRATSILATSATITPVLLDDLRKAGVDEIFGQPFSNSAVMARVESVLLRPRRFIDGVNYRGPCRRRKMLDDYGGPTRRLTDPIKEEGEVWEAESNRALVRLCVAKISEIGKDLNEIDRTKLRAIYSAAQDTEQIASDTQDEKLAEAARSLNRYIVGVGAMNAADSEVVTMHISAMQALSILGSAYEKEREELVRGLHAVVDKRLGVRSSR